MSMEFEQIMTWLVNVRKRALDISVNSESAATFHREADEQSRDYAQAITREEASPRLLADKEIGQIIHRLQPLFDVDAVELARALSNGRCNLALMPIPYKYFRHWRVEDGPEFGDPSVKGALFLLGNAATHYLRTLSSLDDPNISSLKHIAFHLTRAALEDKWQWIVRAPVRNLRPEDRQVIRSGPLELRVMTKPEEKHEQKQSGTGLLFPSWGFTYEGRAARPPIELRTLRSYVTVRIVGRYPERVASGALDELRYGDEAEALLCAALLAFQLLGFEPEGDGLVSQVAYPYWLLNARRTRPVSLPPSRPGFNDCPVSNDQLRRISDLTLRIPGGTFTGVQSASEVALRRFHRAVNLGISTAGFLEHIAALDTVLEMRTPRGGVWSVRLRRRGIRLDELCRIHTRELWELYKLRSKTVHGEIEPSDGCLRHAVLRVRSIASQFFCSMLGMEHRPYSRRIHGDAEVRPFFITTYYPAIRYPFLRLLMDASACQL
jgi:hypothetical protein